MLHVLTVPAFQDNYLWLIHDGTHAIAVDPGDATPVLSALSEHRLTLTAILLTHHHADHVGGVGALLEKGRVPVYGPAEEAIPTISNAAGDGDVVDLATPALRLQVLAVPGHTRGHIAYYASKPGWLFCGDTLFAGGCGRLFEGTPAQMIRSLDRLAALPDETQVFCAHEYTLANLRFALAAEPDNVQLQQRMQVEQARRERGEPTVPSTIGLEKATNPFLRHRETGIVRRLLAEGRVGSDESVTVFAALRQWKNTFR